MKTAFILIMITYGGYGGNIQPPGFQEFYDEGACKNAAAEIMKRHSTADAFCVPKGTTTE